MLTPRHSILASLMVLTLPASFLQAEKVSREERGAPVIAISHADGKWTIRGQKNTAVLNEKDLSMTMTAGATTWKMVPSSKEDLLVRAAGDEFHLRLKDAQEIVIEPYDTGFKSGVKLVLSGFRNQGQRAPGAPLDLRLYLRIAMEGGDEDIVFEAVAVERETAVRELNWPAAMDGSDVDATLLSNDDGILLPRDWPKLYHPIHRAKNDNSIIQSNLIECWSMSWWGFQKGPAAMMVIVETPDDAAYTFSHPAGGPTSIGPQWRAQLGTLAYQRSVRMAFLPQGNYVDLAKRYRRHVIDTGLFVPLKDKIARTPLVGNLIGNPFTGASILRDISPLSPRFNREKPEQNRRLTTYSQHIERLRELKAKGFESLNVTLSGWPNEGYDHQHPDGLPPNKEGGAWQGMKAFFDACAQLGYVCWLHDQYRDYHLDGPSYSPEFAVREEDSIRPTRHFPGTRFHPNDRKEGYIPFMNYWDGGPQAYLNNRLMLGHFQKNYRLIFQHGIHPRGSYNDVFGYVPPDEDFNPERPTTRTDSMKARAEVFNWTRANLGIVGTEDGADWTIPYVDYATSRFNWNPGSGVDDQEIVPAIWVPLYELVYHDAIVTTGSPSNLRSFLHANAASLSRGSATSAEDYTMVRRLAALHKRVGLQEMVRHEFLDQDRNRERTTFADGTTVTVNWNEKTVAIEPDVQP